MMVETVRIPLHHFKFQYPATRLRQGSGRAVWLSAVTGEGIPLLLDSIGGRLRRKKVRGLMRLHPSQGRQRALLFEMGAVTQEKPADDGGWILELEMVERDFRRFLKREKLPAEILHETPDAKPENAALQR